MKPIVIVESPYAGNVELNTRYARAAIRDSLLRGEAPFASHLLYTQEGVLDDLVPEQRSMGIEAGLQFTRVADKVAIYCDLGVSEGMKLGIDRHEKSGTPIEMRYVPDFDVSIMDAGND